MNPAKEVGGDFYDFFLIDDDHLALVMADVSGKGVPAALLMVIAKTLLKNAAQTGLSPKAVLEKVNDRLCENNEAEMFVTVWLGIYEISAGWRPPTPDMSIPGSNGPMVSSSYTRISTALCLQGWKTPGTGNMSWSCLWGTRCLFFLTA